MVGLRLRSRGCVALILLVVAGPTVKAAVPGPGWRHPEPFTAPAPTQAVPLDGSSLLQLTTARVGKTVASSENAASSSGLGSSVYTATLVPLLVVTAVLMWLTRPKMDEDQASLPDGFRRFQLKFVAVWFLAIGADWLQGPYVYALYDSYGYSHSEISQLFVAGFAASGIFGMFVGAMADAWGRKRCALLYCFLYVVSCLTKHCKLYWVLFIGRITGGIATSLLFSTFECWMVSEHNNRYKFSASLIRYMFSFLYFVQYLSAILAGLVAQSLADAAPLTLISETAQIYAGGYVSPFDLSLVLLVIDFFIILFLWEENYGDAVNGQGVVESFRCAVDTLRSSLRVSLLGIVVACFEGAMFAFVLNWTPALADGAPAKPPFGLIFSLFMMACMCGASVFGLFSNSTSPSMILIGVTQVTSIAFLVVACIVGKPSLIPIVFFMFLVFEACVGLYFPAMGTLKSQLVPEQARAGVYNAYRIPLNALVVIINLISMSEAKVFIVCFGLMCLAFLTMFFVRPAKKNT